MTLWKSNDTTTRGRDHYDEERLKAIAEYVEVCLTFWNTERNRILLSW